MGFFGRYNTWGEGAHCDSPPYSLIGACNAMKFGTFIELYVIMKRIRTKNHNGRIFCLPQHFLTPAIALKNTNRVESTNFVIMLVCFVIVSLKLRRYEIKSPTP